MLATSSPPAISDWIHPLTIGPHTFSNNLALAPMAGVTDRCFRQLCRRMGAAICPSEMITSRPDLQQSWKTQARLDHHGEPRPRIVQIAGGDPQMMADAAKLNAERGADILDINMGCPAKKVCKKWAGSALLQDEDLVKRILDATVNAVDIPVTLKMRIGWAADQINGVRIAEIAQTAGIQMLSVHGRTRTDKFKGVVRVDVIKAIKQSVQIPVLANGDIQTPQDALNMFEQTQADGIMVGRAAQGRPWIFQEFAQFFANSSNLHNNQPPKREFICKILLEHLANLYTLYGEARGVKVARKHIGWYLQAEQLKNNTFRTITTHPPSPSMSVAEVKKAAVTAQTAEDQLRFIRQLLK